MCGILTANSNSVIVHHTGIESKTPVTGNSNLVLDTRKDSIQELQIVVCISVTLRTKLELHRKFGNPPLLNVNCVT